MILFDAEFEQEAINRIQKFAKLSEKLGYNIVLGFSGGKDSVVIFDLAKRAGIKFTAYFNQSFESATTINFIKNNYPDVLFRRVHNCGFLENIKKHNGILPTKEISYCCEDYKHNSLSGDNAVIVGVRRAESFKRKKRKLVDRKKRLKKYVDDYFVSSCQSDILGGADIMLRPVVDWTDEEVWNYIYKYNLPINSEYNINRRVGCMICPKTSLSRNYYYLNKYPKLVNSIIRFLEKSGNDFYITREKKYYGSNYMDKVKFVLKWLNCSFREIKGRDERFYKKLLENYKY